MEKKKKIPLRDKIIRLFIAAAISLVLWFIVNGSSDMMVTQDYNSIPITLTNTESLATKNLILSENKNYYLNLKVKGTDKNLRKINAKEISAEVNVGEINEKGAYDMEIAIKGLSNSVIIESMNPSTLLITVDNIIKEDLDVVVNVEGKPANDSVVISSKALEKVEVEGPEESIAGINKIVGVANVNGMETDTVQHVEVLAYDRAGNKINDLEFYPGIIKAEIILGKTKSVEVIPSIIGKPNEGITVSETTVEPSKILIGGKEEALNKVSGIQTDDIDVSRSSKTFTKDIGVTPPEGIYLMEGNTKVKVSVTLEQLIEKTVTLEGVKAINLEPGAVAQKIKDTNISVKLSGASSVLNHLDTSKAEAYIDCSNLKPGEYELPIQVNLPKELIKSILPEKTTVTIGP